MAEESPFIEDADKKPSEETPEAPDNSLLDELKKAGVSNTEELQNKLRASAEVGNMAYKLGEERREKAELLERMKELEAKITTPTEDFSTDMGTPIDLQGEIVKGVKRVLDEEKKAQAQAQRQMMEAWSTIQNDEDFHLVQPVWEEKMKDPNFVYSIQAGQINPLGAYQKMLRQYYKGIIQRSAETIEKLQGGSVKTPTVETGGKTPEKEAPVGESDEVLKPLIDKVESGGQLSEADELAALQAAFLK
jgi:Zn-dependent M32 family carboxypeptidase